MRSAHMGDDQICRRSSPTVEFNKEFQQVQTKISHKHSANLFLYLKECKYAALLSLRAYFSTDSIPGNPFVSCLAGSHPFITYLTTLCKNERLDEAIHAVELIDGQGAPISRDIIYCLLQGCALKMDSEAGKRVHYLMMKHGLDSISVLGDHLIRLFALGGCLYEANQVFWNVSKPSVFTWNAIISAHAKMGRGVRAFELYYKMQQVGIKPDTVTLLCLLKACSVMCALGQGRLIHNQAMRSGLESDITVGSSLVNMYTKCGVLEDAHKLFDSLPNRDIVSWGALIAGYASYGHGFPALELFKEMCKEGVKPNEVILLCVAKACSSIGTIKQGRLIHHEIIRNGSESVVTVANTLVDMYGNCGSLEEAQKVFHKLSNPDVVSWGAIIAGFARYGHYNLAVEYLDRMKRQGLNPDGMIFTSILNACSVAGLLEDAYRCLKSMLIDHGIAPSIEHYGCLIDLLGHKGRLQEAEDLLQTMPLSPNAAVWLSLLSSCKLHHNLKLGWQCFIRVAQMDPGDASGYMLMSNIYANAHLWEDASKVQEWRKSAGARKKGGKAWVEVNSQLHEFMVGGESHQESYYRISYKLKRSGLPLKEEGYVPFVDITIADDRVVDASCGRYGTC